jgi:hypothetical protein
VQQNAEIQYSGQMLQNEVYTNSTSITMNGPRPQAVKNMEMKRTECRHAKVSVTEAGTLQYLVMFLYQPIKLLYICHCCRF